MEPYRKFQDSAFAKEVSPIGRSRDDILKKLQEENKELEKQLRNRSVENSFVENSKGKEELVNKSYKDQFHLSKKPLLDKLPEVQSSNEDDNLKQYIKDLEQQLYERDEAIKLLTKDSATNKYGKLPSAKEKHLENEIINLQMKIGELENVIMKLREELQQKTIENNTRTH